MTTPKIVTQDQYFGWVAHLDNYGGPGDPIGAGPTEQAAIDALNEILAFNEVGLDDDPDYKRQDAEARDPRFLTNHSGKP
jgi:hypothetical protein